MDEKKEYLEKIENLIYSADKFNDMSFRLVLEGLINKGGEEAEYLMVRYISSRELDIDTRINVIRVVGYIQSPHFLIPLKKIIDTEDNIHLKKEAVISVSKYNDRRALNILNYALSNIKNPLLLDTINNEISKIKKNNPVFGLLPRFLEGEKNPKNFEVTLGILKRILRPEDANMFVNYLKCGKPLIENGAFEILCFTGDIDHQSIILKFFQDRYNQITCINQPECEPLYALTLKLKAYFLRFPSLIDAQMDNIGTQLFYVKDVRVQSLFISILCRSRQQPVISFVSKIYDGTPSLRQTIISEYSGNDAASDMLFEKYQEVESSLKGPLIKSLLNCQKGITYFYDNFASLEAQEREIIVNFLPYGGIHDLSDFMIMILQSDYFELKEALLAKVKDHFEFSVKDVLFDADKKQEFFFMEQKYLDTITRVFPVSAVKHLLREICLEDLPLNKTQKYLEWIDKASSANLVISMQEKSFIAMLFHKVTSFNSMDANMQLMSILRKIKTFDMETYLGFNESLGMFVTNRAKQITMAENDELRKVRKNFKDIYYDIRKTDDEITSLERMFSVSEPDFEKVTSFFNQNSLSVGIQIDRVCRFIEKRLAGAERAEIKQWMQFFNKFPMIAFRVKDAILRKAEAHSGPERTVLLKFHQALPDEPIKIVIRLNNRVHTAILREQCSELIPDIPVDTRTEEVDEEDMLLCDPVSLKNFILKNVLPSKLFLFLDNISEFESFKTYNPRPFLKPFSAHRIIKEILKELYL